MVLLSCYKNNDKSNGLFTHSKDGTKDAKHQHDHYKYDVVDANFLNPFDMFKAF